jgi:hypothetical protein
LSILRETKSFLKSNLPSSATAYVKLKDAWRDRFPRTRDPQIVFSDIYENNLWRDPESRSGRGSTLGRTTVIRQELPALLREVSAKSLLDAPCGDFNWMSQTDLGPVTYIGADVVPSLIRRNQRLYGDDSKKFLTLDITRDAIPAADVILCRDCFIHFSFKDIRAALANFKQSNSGYLFATTHTGVREHRDIATGRARNVNLLLPPFNFPEPLIVVVEDSELTKCLGVWPLERLRVQ